jgi:hypothetical protein
MISCISYDEQTSTLAASGTMKGIFLSNNIFEQGKITGKKDFKGEVKEGEEAMLIN